MTASNASHVALLVTRSATDLLRRSSRVRDGGGAFFYPSYNTPSPSIIAMASTTGIQTNASVKFPMPRNVEFARWPSNEIKPRNIGGNKMAMTFTAAVRPFTPADYAQLKSATKAACELASPLTEIVKHTRLDAGTISRACDLNRPSFIPIDVALDLDCLACDDVILRTMAALRGYNLVPIEHASNADNLIADAGKIAKTSGELISSKLPQTVQSRRARPRSSTAMRSKSSAPSLLSVRPSTGRWSQDEN